MAATYWVCKYCGQKKSSTLKPASGQCTSRERKAGPGSSWKPHEWKKV